MSPRSYTGDRENGNGLGLAAQPPGAQAGDLEWARDRPRVVWGCFRCGVEWDDVTANRVIVSPTGCAHYGLDDGVTGCGIDASGEFWWWPL